MLGAVKKIAGGKESEKDSDGEGEQHPQHLSLECIQEAWNRRINFSQKLIRWLLDVTQIRMRQRKFKPG